MFGQPNWKNLRRDIESEDRDFQARRTFCFREEKCFRRETSSCRVSTQSYTVPRAAIRIQRKAKKEKKNTLAFTLPRFHAFSILREKSKSNSVGMNSLSEAVSSQRIKSRLHQYTQLR